MKTIACIISCWILIFLRESIVARANPLAGSSCIINDGESQKHVAPLLADREDLDKLKDTFDLNKPLALLLDFDGTLAEINKTHTNYTVLTVETKQLLDTVANNSKIFMAFISGRNLKDLKGKIGLNNKTYSGNHGLEIEFANGLRHDYKLPNEIEEKLKLLITELKDKVEVYDSWVEDKGLSVTFYYRNLPEELKESLTEEARRIIRSHDFIVQEGHGVIEGKPPVNWQKGEAALYILKETFGDDWCSKVNVIYTGDDNSDEDAMKVLQNMATTFRINKNENFSTYATYRFPKRDTVDDLLRFLLEKFE